ncbi:tRNA uridine-5-carboxymethylaminomethyl(34) synthesis GTPase MnmE [Sphingomonas aliaeris]|uniref:tRNA modification GTPase MnmE n=1 Tax=Sphingomonas aliaeris TaxID=2759526 RepID=A0A974NY92_9SPHN|nr:tRNA uridine-5-carboxymethylaminomethyl(34) synthesis GTPase MnmE [Sphingomonas aliaeris]QQV79155.1 tRNA uridine-5-carboxymethylaminomethyl(34) synthesis GTPase MnmE [Sphingomonas aliaeris]
MADTIFAVSSGAPPAAIAVLRISGPAAKRSAISLAGTLPRARLASLRRLRDPADGSLLDSALVLVFDGPATATGEDLVELHLHGGRAVVAAVERVLSAQPGLRRAEPGEFTRRALAAGRIDLTEAEGLGDLLSAETEGQRRAAILAADGGIRRRIEDWSKRLLSVSAQIEAELDFSDEDDVGALAVEVIKLDIAAISNDVRIVLAQPPVERLRDGVSVVLAGPPNSGKSTLLNAMAGRDAAIVSSIAGTTRDRIEVQVSRNGIAYRLTDTAGLAPDTNDPIEAIGIERARRAIETADIVLWLGDDPPPYGAIWLHARADELGRGEKPKDCVLAVSAHSDEGLSELWRLLEREVSSLLPSTDEIAVNNRQRRLLGEANQAIETSVVSSDLLIVAEGIRMGLSSLDRITGSSDTEAMLDALFGKFCIGK